MENNQRIKMTFPNSLEYSYMVQSFVREIAKAAGFSGGELEQIELAIEESVANIMVHTSSEELPDFDVICDKIPGGLKITLKEMGIPFDPDHIKKYELTGNLDELSTAGLGVYLIQQMVDELHFNNLGPEGKETVMIKYLPGDAAQRQAEASAAAKPGPEVIQQKIEYDVRGLHEDEAIEISRCAYKTHGYTFFDDHIYYPQRLVEMNRHDEMISAVAVTRDNIFMGHGALLYQYPEDVSAELTFVFVNVEYRGQGALNRLMDYLLTVPKRRELRGIYAYAVTNHPYTQKTMLKFDFRDCGLFLATSPASWKFKGISENESQRISVLAGFRYMVPPERLQLFAPKQHQEMIARIYDHLGAAHDFTTPEQPLQLPENLESVIHTGENKLEGCAEIFIATYGTQVVKEIRRLLRHYCLEQYPTINLFLRLADPLTGSLTAEFEKMGFFFAGVIPEFRFGDTLALQYLNNVALDYDKIVLVSDMARELQRYIQAHDPNIIE